MDVAFDQNLIGNYHSKSQIIRVLTRIVGVEIIFTILAVGITKYFTFRTIALLRIFTAQCAKMNMN